MKFSHLCFIISFLLAGNAVAVPVSDARTVSITSYNARGVALGSGSGFFVSNDGLIATAHHIISGATTVLGKTGLGEEFKVSGLVADDPMHDLVILKTDKQRTLHIPFGQFSRLHVSDPIQVVGNDNFPNGNSSKGVITYIENLAGNYQWFAVDASFVPGLSGTPILNDANDVVGMAVAHVSNPKFNFAVSVDSIEHLLTEHSQTPRLVPLAKLKERRYYELFSIPSFQAAMAAFVRDDYKRAAQKIEEAMVDLPDCATLYALQGSYYAAMKAWPQAERSYYSALKLQDNYPMAWAYLSAVLTSQGIGEAGIQAGLTATKLSPSLPEAWLNLGSSYALLKRYDKAREALKRLKGIEGDKAAHMASALETLLTNSESKR